MSLENIKNKPTCLSHIELIQHVDIELIYGNGSKWAVFMEGAVGGRIPSFNNDEHNGI